MKFTEQGAKRIVNAVRRVEKMVQNSTGVRRPTVRSPLGFWARIVAADGKKYSWEQLWATDEDKLDTHASLLTGSHENATGYAIEASESETVPEGSIVWMMPGTSADYYVFKFGVADSLIRFELTEALDLGGSALAVLLEWDGTEWVATENEIKVWDDMFDPGMFAGEEGYRGFAISRPPVEEETEEEEEEEELPPDYDIVQMEQIAAWIHFKSLGAFGYGGPATQFDATVIAYDHQGKDPGSTVSVHRKDDDTLQWIDMIGDCYGQAFYDYSEKKYYIASVERLAFRATATLTANMCGSSASITSFTVRKWGQHTKAPTTTPTSVSNPWGHVAKSGDQVLLERTDTAGSSWEVVNVKKHSIEVQVDTRINAFDLEKKLKTIVVERCESDVPDWTLVQEGAICEGPG